MKSMKINFCSIFKCVRKNYRRFQYQVDIQNQPISNRLIVKFILELISNRSFILKTSDGLKAALKDLKNGFPQGSVLAPMLFNICTYDLPATNTKCVHADNVAILLVGVGRFGANMLKWNLTSSALCNRGEIQTLDHINADCPLQKPPSGSEGLLLLDNKAKQWLSSDYLPI